MIVGEGQAGEGVFLVHKENIPEDRPHAEVQ
jgi:hypothetical protein